MDELSTRREKKLLQNRYTDNVEGLQEILSLYRDDRIEGDPYAVVVLLIGPEQTQVTWSGYPTESDLKRARLALDDAMHPDRAKERAKGEEQERQRIAEYERTHPFKCSHPRCRDRFKSQAALTRHERHICHWYRYDREEANVDTYHR